MAVMKVYQGVLVPSLVLTLWHASGFLPYPIRTSPGTLVHRISACVLPVYTLLLLILYGYFFAIELILFTRTYHDDLLRLEFFTMFILLYREYYFALPLVVLFLLLLRRNAYPSILISVEDAIGSCLTRQQIRIVRLFHYLAWAVLLTVSAGVSICNYYGFQRLLKKLAVIIPGTTKDSVQPLSIIPGGVVSHGVLLWIYEFANSYASLCWSAPTTLILGLTIAIGFGFDNGAKELRRMVKERALRASLKYDFEVCERIAELRNEHRRLRGAITTINSGATLTIIMTTFGDILMPITLISRAFQVDDKAHVLVKLQNEALVYNVYFFAVCALLLAALRLACYVWMNEKAQNVKTHLHTLSHHGTSEMIREVARSFEQEIAEHPQEMAISGGGFFSVDKNFAATLFGIVLTYFLIIYQQKDQKGDMEKLSEEQQTAFASLTRQIMQLNQRLNETSSGCAAGELLQIPIK
ncbi:hypothetical protein BV898_06190 [Hypsibius exemplaris]|uniref:Gustatory receptor n=1 Tax=Hypsibius exemplaris TaxID=2072580 RepID=A0A1W0WXP0_HYPEX|nr:hypothetical protein BV898_06190 [Hypsibius exemplaris]